MLKINVFKQFLAISSFALLASQAQATVHTLAMTGTVANASTSSYEFAGFYYDLWILQLDALGLTNAVTVTLGDTVDATITLDQLVTIPPSGTDTVFGLFLFDTGVSPAETEVTGTTSLFNGASLSASDTRSYLTSGRLVSLAGFLPPDNGAIDFDSVHSNFVVTKLSDDLTLDAAYIVYQLRSPIGGVPEPASWALMIVGFGMTGAMLRRRNQSLATG